MQLGRAFRGAAALAATSLVAVSVLGLFGQTWWVFDLFAHFRIQLAVASIACIGVAWWLRMPRAVGASLLAAISNVAIASPQLVYQPTAEARGRDTIRLVHANVNHYNTHFASALTFFQETDPDVLVIVEANERWVRALEPIASELPYVFTETRGRFGVSIWSRFPMEARSIYFTSNNPSLVARIATPAGNLEVIGTHPRSPGTGRRALRRDAQLAALASFTQVESTPLVLVGDLNTTPWGHAFRSLIAESGLRDTSRGIGYQWTWPATFWPMAIPIDHALISGDVRLVDRRVGPSIGSDHLPLVVDVALDPRP